MAVDPVVNKIWQDILAVGIIAIIILIVYLRVKKKSFNDFAKELKRVFKDE